jgi:hypothetical protein
MERVAKKVGKSVGKGKNHLAKIGCYLGMGGVLFVFLCSYIGAIAARGKRFGVDRTFYFLAEEAGESVSVFAQSVYNGGGAGYLYESNGISYSVLAAYNALEEAQGVANTMAARGRETVLLPVTVGTFYFTTRARAAEAAATEGVVTTALDCADALYSSANKLERGEYTQAEGRACIAGIAAALKGAANGGAASAWLQTGIEKCAEIESGVVYAKDLRYLQIELIGGIVELQNFYSV